MSNVFMRNETYSLLFNGRVYYKKIIKILVTIGNPRVSPILKAEKTHACHGV